MALRGIPPIATFKTENMDRPASLEVTFERLDSKEDIQGMWDLITTPTRDINLWIDGGWVPTQYAAALARHVKASPTGWFQMTGRLDESFAHLIKLVGYEHVKLVGLQKDDYNGKTGKKEDVFVKQCELRVRVALDSGHSVMIKPKNLVPST